MRIAHISTRFSRISETFIYDLILGLEYAGTENHVLTAGRVNITERPFARVHLLPLSLWQKAAFTIQKNWGGVYNFPLSSRTRKTIREIRPDVILAHFGGTGAAIAPVAVELGIPLVVVFHAFDLFTQHVRPETYTALWQSGAHAVAISEHGRSRLLELGCPANCVQLIHCGVDPSRFAWADRPTPRTGEFRLVSIGRLVEKKGFDDLIRAVSLVRSRMAQPVRVDIFGTGPLKRHLIKLARTLGVDDAISFKGIVDSEDVPRLLREYDAFVLPSRTAHNGDTEGIPITILEAQAAGLPLIASLHAGIPEAVPPPNREWLAREGDARDLADKLFSLASHPECWPAISRCGKEWISRHFSLQDEVNAYLHLFKVYTAAPRAVPKGKA